MLIGIDCSRAFGNFWGGPESYSYYLIQAILRTPSSHTFRLYLPPNASQNPRYNSFFSGLDTSTATLSVIPDGDPACLTAVKELSYPSRHPELSRSVKDPLPREDPSGSYGPQDDGGSRVAQDDGGSYELREINWKRLWTQGGLALECLINPPDALFVPAHTLPMLRRPGLKTVVTVHDLGAEFLPNYHKFPQKYYLNTMTEYAVKNATRIIAVSNYTKQDIMSRFHPTGGKLPPHPSGVEAQKIQVIYEGYDRETFYPRSPQEINSVKKKLGIEGEYFLFVGTIQPRKNLVRLIEAFSQIVHGSELVVRSSAPSMNNKQRTMSLVLAGAPGWLNEEIYAAPKKFGVDGQVKFVGPVPHNELPALISGSIAFVFPSLFEGFGLAPLEAMACGVPVIISNVTSLPEVGGEAALYVDPNSAQDIAGKMELVLTMSNADRESAVENGIAQAGKFSWEQAAAETLRVLEETSGLKMYSLTRPPEADPPRAETFFTNSH